MLADWVNTTDPATGKPARRETSTMPQWAGSCWYYLRYIDPANNGRLVDPEKVRAMWSFPAAGEVAEVVRVVRC